MIKLLAALLLLTPISLKAQNLVNESKTGLGMGPSLSLSEVDYENENGNTFTFKRKTLGFVLNAPLNSDIGALFQVGYTWKSEFDGGSDDGKGYVLGGGINGYFHKGANVSFVGYGILNYLSDEFKHRQWKTEMSTFDLHLGTLAVFSASRNFDIYCGLDLVPVSDGEMKTHTGKISYEREDALGIKLGANIGIGKGWLRPEITLGNEKTFTLTATF